MTMERVWYLQWLMSCHELPGRILRSVLERYPDPVEMLSAPRRVWEEMFTARQVEFLWKHIRETGTVGAMEQQYEKMTEQGISFVGYGQDGYPERLAQIPDAPLGLYYKGRLPDRDGISVAIVGSRDCSEYGRYVARELGSYLGGHGVTVISGMARGIDGISQQAALEAGGESYGVLGSGVDICYPASNRRLYQLLMERGGVLSAYPPGVPPISRHFPPRNRIVSGLSMAIVVIEAAVKSGTSITVSMALEQGRDVFVVPGRVTDRLSEGCNRLIRQGAGVYLDPESFLEELQETFFLQRISPVADYRDGRKREAGAEAELPKESLAVWRVLDHTPKSVEEIHCLLEGNVSVQELSIRLMELVMDGKAKQVSTGYFCRG